MKTKKLFATFTLVIPLFCISGVYAGDGFESVRCGEDVVKALRGRKTVNEPVVNLEARHKDIGLKDLGAEYASDDESLGLVFWMICGEEYATLESKNFVRDVIKIPKHSKETPEFVGSCQLNGKELPGIVVGVLKNEEGAAKLPAVKVWKIDEKQKKFIELPTEGLRCGRDGISSEDDGH
jgi:hypothetical protein